MLHRREGNYIVAETNQGYDMVKTIIHNIDSDILVKAVHALRGKVVRADPVIALYERGMVHHVGVLPGLEDQMTTWDSRDATISPGRIDALVYGVAILMCKQKVGFVLV
jgi:phage terminase large subunit-like protein